MHQNPTNLGAAAARPAGDPIWLEKRVAELEAELADRTREIGRINEETRHLLYGLSHDLRESSRMVRSYVQLLARRYEGKLDEDASEFIRFALGGVSRSDELLDDLLAYSRVLNAPERPFETVALEFALEQAICRLAPAIRESGSVITHDPLPVLPGDEGQLPQLFFELLDNAIKFRRTDPPRIHVRAEPDEEGWHLAVHDNGQGIRPEYHGVVFSPLRRLHGRDYPGTGMGLAVARRIVERHGGRIWVSSSGVAGAAFHFTLRG